LVLAKMERLVESQLMILESSRQQYDTVRCLSSPASDREIQSG
jgi:hypothetical protein